MNINKISDILSYQAKMIPNKIAVFSKNRSYTYKELDDLVLKLANYLLKKEIKQKDVCLHYFEDEYLTLFTMLASARIGATLVSLPTLNSEKIKDLKEVTDAKYLISDIAYNLDETIHSLIVKLDDFIDLETNENTKEINPNIPWQIIIGSGTTNKEKLFEVSQGLELERIKIIKDSMKKTSEDIVASLIRLNFNSAKLYFLASLYAGASYFLLEENITDFAKTCSKNKITVLHATVFYIENILNSIKPNEVDVLNFLRVLSIGSSTVTENLKQKIKKHLTKNLYIFYGANEVTRITTTNIDTVFKIEQTVGITNDGVEIQIVDEKDKVKDIGDIGHIRVKSKGMITEYFNDTKNTKKFFKDGWFYPGDLGKFTEEKELIYLGRSDYMMILNGINIYPAQIENILLEHKEIEDVACVPIKDVINQDIPICAVVLKEGSSLSKPFLLNFCHKKLGKVSVKDIVILKKIQKNNLGKLQRKLLQETIYKELLFKNNDIRQNTKKFTIELKQQKVNNLSKVYLWLEKLFDIKEIKDENQKKDIYTLSNITLFLIRKLLQISRIPVFYLGEIDSIFENNDRYTINLNIVYIDFVPLKYYTNIINSSFEFLYLMMDNEPTNPNIKYFINKYLKELISPIRNNFFQGEYQLELLKKAYENNIPFIHLGNSIYQLGWGDKAKKIDRSTTQEDSALGLKLSTNKIATANILRRAGLPTPKHGFTTNKEEALVLANNLSYPIVVKPLDLGRGEGVSVNITNQKELFIAFDKAYELSPNKKVIIEKQVKGVCHRIFIAHEKFLYCVKRLPIGVYGDGENTILSLIDKANQEEEKKLFWEKKYTYFKDKEAINLINKLGYTLNSIPKKDIFIPLRDIETTNWGGIDEDVSSIIHKDNINIALKATKLLGLSVAGVDIICENIAKPWHETDAIINEVNFAPVLGGAEISKGYINKYLKSLIKEEARIPIELFVGDKKIAFEKAIQKQKEYREDGINCFLTTNENTYDSNNIELKFKNFGLIDRCEALLLNNTLEALLIIDDSNLFYKYSSPFDKIKKIHIC